MLREQRDAIASHSEASVWAHRSNGLSSVRGEIWFRVLER